MLGPKTVFRLAMMSLALLIGLGALGDPMAGVAAGPPSARDLQYYYNRFGDPWATNRGPNPFIPVGLTAPCHRRGPRSQLAAPTREESAFLAKSGSPIVVEACAMLPEDDPKLRAAATALKARAPHLKYIAYVIPDLASTGALNEPEPLPAGLTAINRREEWFVHKPGRPATREHRVRGHNRLRQEVLDLTNPQFQEFFVRVVVRSMDRHNLGGVLVDGCATEPLAGDPNEVAPELRARWAQACLDFLARLKRAIGRNRLLLITGVPETTEMLKRGNGFTEQRLRIADGLLWEDPISALGFDLRSRRFDRIERINMVFDLAQRLGNKYVGVWVNTNINGPGNIGTFADTNLASERAYARYYLAAYLNLMRGAWTPLLYYTPVPGARHFHSTTFFREWNLRIGRPVGGSEEISNGKRTEGSVYRRPFADNQWAYLNNTTRPYTVKLRTARDTATGGAVSLYTADGTPLACDARRLTCTYKMPPKTGELFVTATTLRTR